MNKILVLILMCIILSKTNAQQKITYKFINLDSTNINELYELNKLNTGYLTKYKIDTTFSGSGLNIYKNNYIISVSKSFTGYYENGKKQGLFYMYPYNYCYEQYAKYYYILDYNQDTIHSIIMVFDSYTHELIYKVTKIKNTDNWCVDDEIVLPEERILSLFFSDLHYGIQTPLLNSYRIPKRDEYYKKENRYR